MKQGVNYGDILDYISKIFVDFDITNEEAIIVASMVKHALVSEEWRLLQESLKEQQKKMSPQKM